MMRSLFTGVSGIKVHQTKMDVIANNIANVNTAGYKYSRVTFSDVFNQTLSGATRANGDTGRGGTNPKQIGLGSNVASIDQIMTTGATQRTDWSYDVMIDGEGFFILQDESGYYFSRAGAFRVDESGNLTNSDGLPVCGWQRKLDTDPTSATYGQYVIQKGKVSPIQITQEMEYADPETTTMINMAGNLNAALDGAEGYVTTMSFYDSVGNRYVSDVKYTYYSAGSDVPTGYEGDLTGITGTNGAGDTVLTQGLWTMEIVTDQDGNNAYLADDTSQKFNFNMGFQYYDNDATGEAYNGTDPVFTGITVQFDSNGNIVPFRNAADDGTTTQLTLVVEPAANMKPAADFGREVSEDLGDPLNTNKVYSNKIIFEMKDMRQVNSSSNATGTPVDGMEPGTLTGTSIGTDGSITGIYSNGTTRLLAQIAITTFKNPAGLEKVGSSLFRATSNSGDFDGVGQTPGSGGGSLLSGSLEMSNVDLASEFTEMITTQRGYQANARVITTSDDLLQELVNLKR